MAELNYSKQLWDGFEVVSKRADEGLETCKDISNFFKKRASIEDEYSKSLASLCKSTAGGGFLRKKAAGRKEIGTLKEAWLKMQDETNKLSLKHADFSAKILSEVCQPIYLFTRNKEISRKQLVTDGNRLTKDLQDSYSNLTKAKQNYDRSCKDLELANSTLDKSKSDASIKTKDLQKIQQKATKSDELTVESNNQYKQALEVTNKLQEKFYKDDMPAILDEFQQMENDRIDLLKQCLDNFIGIQETVPPAIVESCKTMKEHVANIDKEKDVRDFIEENISGEVPPKPVPYEPYNGQPVESTSPSAAGGKPASEIEKIDQFFQKKNDVSKYPFNCTLEELMEKQKADFPDMKIPRILEILIDYLMTSNSAKTEGIFRIPPDASELKALKQQFENNMEYKISVNDPHIPAALLKLWLRELPDPLIPTEQYSDCTSIGGKKTPEQALAILSKLPPTNRYIVARIITFLRVCVQPENVEKSKMSVDNMAMIFAPSFLRNPNTDAHMIMMLVENEKMFLKSLIEGLPLDKLAS
jgi:hypothetical protein